MSASSGSRGVIPGRIVRRIADDEARRRVSDLANLRIDREALDRRNRSLRLLAAITRCNCAERYPSAIRASAPRDYVRPPTQASSDSLPRRVFRKSRVCGRRVRDENSTDIIFQHDARLYSAPAVARTPRAAARHRAFLHTRACTHVTLAHMRECAPRVLFLSLSLSLSLMTSSLTRHAKSTKFWRHVHSHSGAAGASLHARTHAFVID